jgi:hypothetical protein
MRDVAIALVAEVNFDDLRQTVRDNILEQGIRVHQSMKIIADGGLDHLREVIKGRLIGKGHDEKAVMALVDRIEKGDDPKEKISLALAVDHLIEQCRKMGIAVDFVLRSSREE